MLPCGHDEKFIHGDGETQWCLACEYEEREAPVELRDRRTQAHRNALQLIRWQDAEIERLKNDIKNLWEKVDVYCAARQVDYDFACDSYSEGRIDAANDIADMLASARALAGDGDE